MMEDKKVMTVNQAAEYLGITPSGIRKHLDRGNIKGDRKVGRMWLILKSEVDKIKGGRPGPKPKSRVDN